MRGRARRWLALGVGLALLAGACSRGDDDDDSPSTIEKGTTEADAPAEEGGRLVVGLDAAPTTFDPTVGELSATGLTYALAVFDPLMATDADGNVVPYLAESLEQTSDLVWTLVLRDGVVFSNGEPLTSAAVVRVFDEHLSSELTRTALRDIESVGAYDRRTVEFRMKRPWATFPRTLTGRFGLVPAPSMLDAGEDAVPVGTGPFVVKDWQPGAGVHLERSPTYWRREEGLPHLDELELRGVADPEDRVEQLVAGTLDVIVTGEPDGIAALAAADDVGTALEDDGVLQSYTIVFNTATPPFDDIACRRALAGVIDREAIADEIAPEILLVPDGDSGDGDDAPDCDFALRTGSSSLDDGVSTALRSQMDDAGIDMTLAASSASDATLDALLGRFEAYASLDDLDDPDERFVALDAANVAPIDALSRNLGRFADDDVQDALLAARAEGGDDADALVEEQIDEKLPYVTLFRVPWAVGFDPIVGGIRVGLTLPDGGEAQPRSGVLLLADLHTTKAPA